MWKAGIEIHLYLYINYRFHCVSFHETQHNLLNCCGHVLYQLLPKSYEKCRRHIQNFKYCTPSSKLWLSLHLFSRKL